MAMSAPSDNLERLDELQRNINNVLVQTSKALKMAAKGSRPTPASLSEASSSINSNISSSYYSFNYALDDLEHEINRAKAVLLRDLNELKAKRMTPPPEPKPAAPPAPMDFHVDDPPFDLSSVTPAAPSAQSKPFEQSAPDRLIKQEAAPVAPVPNMGLDFPFSPEAVMVVSPALSQAKVTAMKSSPKVSPKVKGAQAVKPSSAPIKKEPKTTVSPQLPRSSGQTAQAAQPTAAVAPQAPMQATQMDQPPAPPDAAAALQPEMVFTDMAFSVDESQGGGQLAGPPPNQQQDLDNMMDLTPFTGLGPADSGLGISNETGGPAGDDTEKRNQASDTSNLNNSFGPDSVAVANVDVDAELNDILNSTEPGSAENLGMDDYSLGGDIGSLGVDESNGFGGSNSFDDMWYADGSGGEAEFGGNDSYYGA